MSEINIKALTEKWAPLMDKKSVGTDAITETHRRNVTAVVLENQEQSNIKESGQINEVAANATGANVASWDPILISMVRRSMPNLIAFDLAGVQPMTGPTGLIFAMKSKYSTQDGTEALFNEADTGFSGSGTVAGGPVSGLGGVDTTPADGINDLSLLGTGMTTAQAEALGNTGAAWGEMAFSIEKATATAKSRALKAEYTDELAQDLKAVHGLSAETELAQILSTEILAEMNREMIRTINFKAKLGAQQGDLTAAGSFDMVGDADGRWHQERYKGLIVQLEREANVIGRETRRGKANWVLCSSDVATALATSGMLSFSAASVDDTGSTFVGTLSGRIKVYIDPYANDNYLTVGYKGTNPYDAGIFYCPYVPLTMMKTIGESDFQPKIGFKTRYGMVANPFAEAAPVDDTGANRSNPYFRIFAVTSILGG